MDSILMNLLYLLSRYFHIVATSMLVGGVLFHELIVPVAIGELKDEQKLAVFARARWAFRGIVYLSAIVLLATGCVSTYRNWYAYSGIETLTLSPPYANLSHGKIHFQFAGYWLAAHAAISMLGIVLAVGLVTSRTPPRDSLLWMRIVLLILLLAIFMASTTRHVRLRIMEEQLPPRPAMD